MIFRISLTLVACFLFAESLQAQSPENWTRTAERKMVEGKSGKITHHGEWLSKDETRTAMMVSVADPKTPNDLKTSVSGVVSGVLRSGILPLKFEPLANPHPVLIVRGQAEYQGTEYFQDTYVVFTKKGLLMIKITGGDKDLPFELKKWEVGEPVDDINGEFASQMKTLSKQLNGGITNLQNLVKKNREASKIP